MRNILLLLLTAAIFYGCGSKEKENQQSNTSSAVEITESERNALYDMKYKFNKGEKFNYLLTTITNTTQSVSSDTLTEMDVTQTIKYKFAIDVLNVDESNTGKLNISIENINLTAVYEGQTVKYDSEMELSDEKKMEFFEYETLKNSTYNAEVKNTGEIVSVTNLDQMIDNMIKIQNYQEKLSDDERAGVAENLSAMLVKPLTQHLFRVLPEKEIGIDSVWEHRYPSSLATFQIENIASFRVLRIAKADEDKVAEFSAALRIKASGENTFSENDVNYYFDEPIVSGSGNIKFNIDKGCLVKSKTTTRVETQGIVEAKDEMGKYQRAERKDITVSTNIIEKK